MNDTETRKTILDKISKLLAMQESTTKIGNIEEATVFSIKIKELLDKYNLSIEDITIEEIRSNIIESSWAVPNSSASKGNFKPGRRVSDWREVLAVVVAEAYDCQITIPLKQQQIRFFGMKQDVDIAIAIYSYLDAVIDHECNKQYSMKYIAGEIIPGSQFKKNFRYGAVHMIKKRLSKPKTSFNDSRSLVVRKSAAIQDYINRNVIWVHTKNNSKYEFNNDAMTAGKKFGETVNFEKIISTTKNTKQLSTT